MSRFFIIIISLLAFLSSAEGQERKILLRGKVADSFTEVGIPNVKIQLLKEDSTLIDSTDVMMLDMGSTYPSALFAFRIPAKPKTYIICVDHPNYEKTFIKYRLKSVGRNSDIDLPLILMKKKRHKNEVMLNEIKVIATKIKMYYKGDTIVYNADAFNIPEGSMLDGLIKQMPGVELKTNGEIFVNGKKIDYLTLNGKDFFSGNNKLMLENLPYYMVEKIKVYNKQTERAASLGLKGVKPDYVMDVNLKRQYSQGYIANVEGGAGSEDSYINRLFGLRFTNHSRFTLIGNLNNLNTEYNPHEDGSWYEGNDFGRDGRTTRKMVTSGLSIDNKKLKNNLEITMGWQKSTSEQKDYTETVLPLDSSVYSKNHSQETSHTFRTNINNKFTLNVPFLLQSSTSFNYERNRDISGYDYASNPVTQTYLNINRGHDMNISQTLQTTHKFAWGDVLDIYTDFGFNKNEHHATEIRNTNYISNIGSETNSVYTNNPFQSYHYKAGISYGMNDLHNGVYNLILNYEQNQKTEEEKRYDMESNELDINNSHHLNQLQRSFYGALQYTYFKYRETGSTDISFTLPVHRELRRSYYQKSTLDTCAWQRKWFFEPKITIDANKNGKGLSLDAAYQQSMTEVTSLITVPNTIDPIRTYIGNPNLKSMSQYHVGLWYIDNSKNRESKQTRISLHWNQYFNQVTQSYLYNAANGHFIYQPCNINGNWDGDAMIRYSCRFKKEYPFYFSTETGFDFSHTSDYSGVNGSTANTLRNMNFINGKEEIKFYYDKNGQSIELVGSIRWIHSSSNSSNFENVNALHYRYGVTGNLHLPWNISFSTTLMMEHRRGYTTSSMNTNECVWDATIARSFFPGNKLLVRLSAVDIFHDYSAISYTVSANGRTETWRYSLPAYILLRLSYKLNLNPKK